MGDINQDPSMEEILASIKRVIAEDGRGSTASREERVNPPAEAPIPAEEPEDDVLELSNPVSDEDGLMSEDSTEASRQSLAALAALRQQSESAGAPAIAGGDGPLEAVVREMLKPILKDWLDQRLPEMVEELVTREIARITGKSL